MQNENKPEVMLSIFGCILAIADDYGINMSHITPKIGEHMADDLMDLLCKQGYLTKAESSKASENAERCPEGR